MLLKVEKKMSGQKVCKGKSMKAPVLKGIKRKSYKHLASLGNFFSFKNLGELVEGERTVSPKFEAIKESVSSVQTLIACSDSETACKGSDGGLMRRTVCLLESVAALVAVAGRCVLLAVRAWLLNERAYVLPMCPQRVLPIRVNLFARGQSEKRTKPCVFNSLRWSKSAKNAPNCWAFETYRALQATGGAENGSEEHARVRKTADSFASEYCRVYRINRTVSRFDCPEDHAERALRGGETKYPTELCLFDIRCLLFVLFPFRRFALFNLFYGF